jgi:tetraacyldisaccharide 4'-kinase
MRVVAVGGLAVGGAGKTSLARWAAMEAHAAGWKPALLLRGHGGSASHLAPQAVPSARPGDAAAVRWFGDEAIAHRAALPRDVPVIAGKDRLAAARLAASLGAELSILDDGWEQPALSWDALWVALDPVRPLSNGWSLPAGALRQPPINLRCANAIVGIYEAKHEQEHSSLREVAAAYAPACPIVEFRRRVHRIAPIDGRGEDTQAPAMGEVLLVSSVGAPERLDRFLAGEGAVVGEHLAFPDHAAWNATLVLERAAAAARRGGRALLVTDKDAARARLLPALPLETFVLSTRLEPLHDPEPLVEGLRGGEAPRLAAPTPIG